jgi:hypothetical protein
VGGMPITGPVFVALATQRRAETLIGDDILCQGEEQNCR